MGELYLLGSSEIGEFQGNTVILAMNIKLKNVNNDYPKRSATKLRLTVGK